MRWIYGEKVIVLTRGDLQAGRHGDLISLTTTPAVMSDWACRSQQRPYYRKCQDMDGKGQTSGVLFSDPADQVIMKAANPARREFTFGG